MDFGSVNDHKKLLGRLDLDVSPLSKSIKEAKEQIDELSDKAYMLGKIFNEIGAKTDLSKLASELKTVASGLTNITDEVSKKFTQSSQKVAQSQAKVIEAISHSLKIGNISYEEAYQQAKTYLDKIEADLKKAQQRNWGLKGSLTKQGKADEWKPLDDTPYTTEIRKAESFIEDIRRQIERVEQAFQKSTERQTKQISNTLVGDLQHKYKVLYKGNLVAYQKHLSELLMSTELTAKDREKIEKQLADTVNKLRQQALSDEKQANEDRKRLSSALVGDLQHKFKVTYAGNLIEYKQHLEQLLNNDKLTVKDREKVQKQLADTIEKINKKIADDNKKLNKQLLDQEKQRVKEFNQQQQQTAHVSNMSPQGKFANITNYAFDAGLIYGGMNTVRQMVSANLAIEKQTTELSRIMTNASKFDLEQLRENAFEVARQTNNTVDDVQKIQNYWVRVSDEIANNKQLLMELSEVTSTALNVGGFQDANEAVQLLQASINQLGLAWSDAEMVLDSWIKMADSTAVGSAKDMADNINRVGTQAKTLGLGLHELNAITGIFANNMAKSGEEIGTAMKTVFSYFQNEDTIKILYKHGVQVMKNAEEYRNFVDIMNDLMNKYREYEAKGNERAIYEINNALGRIRRVDYVGTLISNWDEFSNLAKTSLDSVGYASEQNEKMMGTLEAQINELQVAFQQLAVAVGETGLLADLKGLVDAGINIIDYLNGMDSGTKRFVSTMLEMGTVLLLVSKGFQLLMGTGVSQWLGNLIGRWAVATQSQKMLNLAMMMGADVTAQVATANTAETASEIAQNAVKQQGIIVDAQGNALKTVSISQSQQQTVANGAETASWIAVRNAKVGANTATGLLGGAIAGLLNPFNLLMGAVTIGISLWQSYKQKQEEARLEAERFAEANKNLAEKMQGWNENRVISEYEITDYKQTIGKIEETLSGLQQAKAEVAQLEQQMSNIDWSTATDYSLPEGFSEISSKLQDARKSVEDFEKKLKELGTTSATAQEDIRKLEAIVTRSSDADRRSAFEVINKMEAMMKNNNEIREAIVLYQRLHADVMKTGIVTDEYRRVVNILTNAFPQLEVVTDSATGAMHLNVNAMNNAIGAYGTLTQAQMNEVIAMANLSENAKTLAYNYINSQITMTKETLKASKQRAQALEAELKAFQSTSNSYTQRYNELMAKYRRGETLSEGEQRWLYGYGSYIGRQTSQVMQAQNEVAKLEAELRKLESQLSTVNKIVPVKAFNFNTPSYKPAYNPNSSSSKSTDPEEAKREAERLMEERERAVLDLQSQLVDALKEKYEKDKDNRIKALQEMEKAEVAVYEARIKKLQDEIKALQDTRDEERENIASLKEQLELWKKDDSDYGKQRVKQLEKQIKEKEKALTIADKQAEIQAIEDEKKAIQDNYKERLDSSSEYYDTQLKILDNALKEKSLYAEANELIKNNHSTQQQILNLLVEYQPKYAGIGQLMGKSMSQAMLEELKIGLDSWNALIVKPSSGGSSGGSGSSGSSGGGKPWDGKQYHYGSKGETVKEIQRALNSMGYKLAVDGSFGPATKNAVMDFQRKKGLKVDGYVGNQTWSALFGASISSGSSKSSSSGSRTYTVKSGDNLWDIAAKLYGSGAKYKDLMRLNGLSSDRLRVGQILKYAEGGLINHTGLAWVDGSFKKPEMVLNPIQTEIFRRFVKYLPQLQYSTMANMPSVTYNAPLIQNDIKIVNNTPFDVANNMDNLERAMRKELKDIGYNRGLSR